jgi:DNA-binding transcriptional regulator GbsR (MarR family)
MANSASLANPASPNSAKPLEPTSILTTLTPNPGFLRLPNWILDSLPSFVDSNEQLMYIHLYRLSHGFGKDQCLVSLDKLAERTGFSKRTVQTVLQNLENKSLITKLKHNFGKGIIQGTIFRVATITSLAEFASPAKNASLANSATIKDHHDDLKKHDHHPHQLPNITDHQKQVMMIYQEITGNLWTKTDTANYEKIKNVPIEKIEVALRLAYDRATNRPNSFAFFIKEILSSLN